MFIVLFALESQLSENVQVFNFNLPLYSNSFCPQLQVWFFPQRSTSKIFALGEFRVGILSIPSRYSTLDNTNLPALTLRWTHLVSQFRFAAKLLSWFLPSSLHSFVSYIRWEVIDRFRCNKFFCTRKARDVSNVYSSRFESTACPKKLDAFFYKGLNLIFPFYAGGFHQKFLVMCCET